MPRQQVPNFEEHLCRALAPKRSRCIRDQTICSGNRRTVIVGGTRVLVCHGRPVRVQSDRGRPVADPLGQAAAVRDEASSPPRTGAAMRMLRPLNRLASVTFDDGSRLIFPIGDVYWNAFLWQKDFDYEPEVRHLLQALYTTDYLFIDAGANIGYWSVLVTSAMLGRKRADAIEASPETFAFLKLNSAANDDRFGVSQNAIFATDGIKLGFTRGPHSTRHIAYDLGRGVDTMTSVTLDTIAGDASPQQKVVVKLDVEGSEVEALAGCRRLLQRDTLIIFEDHGNDSTHATTGFVMENALPVYWLTDHGRILAVPRPGDLDKLKINRYRG